MNKIKQNPKKIKYFQFLKPNKPVGNQGIIRLAQ